MCCCGKPVINGQPGYSWDGKRFGVYPISPPDLQDGDQLICDEPGRCGGVDSHSHHFRVVKSAGAFYLLVRHGGGDERICLGSRTGVKSLESLDSNSRYWLLQMIYYVQDDAARNARGKEHSKWMNAAAEKRIKTRKQRKGYSVKVWIEPATVNA